MSLCVCVVFRMTKLTWLFMLRLMLDLDGAGTGVLSNSSCLSRAAASVDESTFREAMRGQNISMCGRCWG